MLIQIDTHRGVPLYRQIMDQVTRMIVSGEMHAGEQLESVASLAGRLKLNPMTISKAYGFLVENGLVERRPGVGLFVCPVDGNRKSRVKQALLAQALGQAAALAAQLGLAESEAAELFAKEYRKMKSQLEEDAS